MSKNRPTIEHLTIACRHVGELLVAGVTENHAIRTLELLCDYYALLQSGGRPGPHHREKVHYSQWSVAARRIAAQPDINLSGRLRVEHGTPRRAFAQKVLHLYESNNLTEEEMDRLVACHWKLAVITVEEDASLTKIARSKPYNTPGERWEAAGIKFQTDEPKKIQTEANPFRRPNRSNPRHGFVTGGSLWGSLRVGRL